MEKEYSLGTSNEVIVKAATSLSTIGVAYSVITQVQNGQSIAKLESGRDDGGKIE
jgi:hypothetical protein